MRKKGHLRNILLLAAHIQLILRDIYKMINNVFL